MAKYLLAEELRTTFQAKADKADRELNAKYQKLEKDMMDAQDKIQKGLVTRATAEQMQQDIINQQQELVNTRDRMMNELAEEEMVMNNRIYYAVMDYLKEYNADYKYSMIISTTASGPILHAEPSMDITDEVLEALNARYTAGQK
jgi:outer membrane protein